MEQIKEQLTDIKSMNMDELTEFIISLGEKKFRAKQIYEWIHVKHVESFDEMTNISKKFIQVLKDNAILISLKKEEVQVSKLDGTRKYLFALDDGNVIESVLMKYKHGNSVCISSQVGCRMGCRFCASTLDGLVRGLRPSEMIDQIYQIGKDIGERISNVVVMGTGEPLDNYDNLLRFIELLTDENGINISQRNLTVSTCGLVPRMRQLADEKLSITLALSLHASNQEKRKALMPVANSYDIHDVVDACKYYFAQTGRRVTFEYSLVGGVNDTAEDAAELSALVHGMNCHINLIPVNPIKERDYVQSNKGTGEPLDNYDNLLRFIELLTDENGINISQRNLTVSTCGLVPRMRQLADEKLSITLALSLHASNQEKRKALMPVANSYDIHDVVDACKYYFAQTGRRVTFEYSLVGGVNDTAEDAAELSALVHGMNCHINLIPVNPIKERDYVQSNKGVIEAFKNRLEKNGINVTIRREMGRDIDGACGQLRKKHIDKERGIN